PVSIVDTPSPNPSLSEIKSLLMEDCNDREGTASPGSDCDRFLEEILVQLHPQSDESEKVEPLTPEELPREPVSKKQIRQMRNRDAA
ncbi:hypothetical protein RYX36_000316, partial [Vicia faba]